MASYVSSLIGWFNAIPNVVWSGVIGALVALLGVWASNASNTKRLMLQLDHDSREKDRDRKAELRRAVYLDAIEETIKANAYLGSLATVDPTKKNVGSKMQPFFAASAKIWLVADSETALLTRKLTGLYGESFMRLSTKVITIRKLTSQIEDLTDWIDRAKKEVQRVNAAITQFHETCQSNQAIYTALLGSSKTSEEHLGKLLRDKADLWKRMIPARMEFGMYVLTELEKLQDFQVEVICSLRRELGLQTDVAQFKAQQEEQRQRIVAAFEEFRLSVQPA